MSLSLFIDLKYIYNYSSCFSREVSSLLIIYVIIMDSFMYPLKFDNRAHAVLVHALHSYYNTPESYPVGQHPSDINNFHFNFLNF